jgi:hypothetical protein
MKKISIVAALAAVAYATRKHFAKANAAAGLTQPLTYAMPPASGQCCDTFPHCGCNRIG